MIAEFLRGAADFWDAVQVARAEQRTGFSEREAGDFLDASGITDGGVSDGFMDVEDLGLPRSSEPQSPVPPGHVVDVPECKAYLPGGDLPIRPVHPIFCELPAGHPGEHISFKHPDRAIVRWPRADDVVDAEVHCTDCQCPTICGCGREIYGEPESPDGPTYWFHRDDDSPITLQCARIPLAEPTAEELADLASRRDVLHVIPDPHEVSHDDLTAHITASRRAAEDDGYGDTATDEWIATDLRAAYSITPKK